MPVNVNTAQYDELKDYSNLSGIPVEQLLEEALEDYLECVVSSRTEALMEKAGD
ncbi:MAG: ribbon-helix-helix domain-containing protein [Candidatus Sulfotelmatobacter sp.]